MTPEERDKVVEILERDPILEVYVTAKCEFTGKRIPLGLESGGTIPREVAIAKNLALINAQMAKENKK